MFSLQGSPSGAKTDLAHDWRDGHLHFTTTTPCIDPSPSIGGHGWGARGGKINVQMNLVTS